MTARLAFGYNAGIPEGTETAWGARLIVDQDGYTDLLRDRQDAVGPETKALLTYLNASNIIGKVRDTASKLLKAGTMQTRESAEFLLYEDANVQVRGNTNGSAGYLYIAAFFTAKVAA